MIEMLKRLSSLILVAAAATPAVAQYRGMPAGWPTATYTAPTSTGYAPTAGGQAYYVARPVYAQAPYGYQYAANQYAGSQYAPATVAYANPAYRAGYNTTLAAAPQAQAAYRPVQYVAAAPQGSGTTAYYAPQAYSQQAYGQQAYAQQAYAGQAPAVAYYAPTTAQYAPGSAYSVTPAGGMSAGAEAYAGYGQSAPVNYTPPRFVYRTVNAQVPVYAWRPVTVYQPVTGQAVTCLQPAAPATQCQTQRRRWFSHSWFSHSWFGGSRSSCGSGGCGTAPAPAPAPTTAMCTTGYCGSTCGTTPYYNTQPTVILPTAPAPGTTIVTPITPGATLPTTGAPTTTFPGSSLPGGSSISPPPTRFPNSGGVIIPSSPADSRPSLTPPPTGSFQTNPGLPPGATVTPITPGGTGGTGSFGTGTNYPPASDPYTPSSSSRPSVRQPATDSDRTTSTRSAASEGPELHPQVRANPDPDAVAPPQPINRAPQLLDPRDKTAQRSASRWGVVPAVWPTRPAPVQTAGLSQSPYHSAAGSDSVANANTGRVTQERSLRTSESTRQTPAAAYDASGWESAR
jgi:hypothetical protein